MTTAVAARERTMTPEEMLARPDGGRGYELVDGQLEGQEMCAKSSRLGGKMYRVLDTYCDQHPGWAFPPETGFRCFADDPNRVRKPDAAYIAFDRLTVAEFEDEGFLGTVPDLVAEVISPNDISDAVDRKITEWLAAGVRVVWVVHPVLRMIREHRGDGSFRQFRVGDALTEPTLLPGFACPVADLFRLPGEVAGG